MSQTSQTQEPNLKEEMKRLLLEMLEEREITFSDYDIDPELCEKMMELGIAVKVGESGDYFDYVLVPPNADVDVNALSKSYNAMTPFMDFKEISKVLALMMYSDVAGGFEFVDLDKDGQIAWIYDKIFQHLGIEPDEVVDLFDYRDSYVGPIYKRYGKVWIRKHWVYCNSNRFHTVHGVFKGVEYAIEPPKTET